jgi:hypothetical protein
MDPDLWQRTMLLILGWLLAILAGRCLPDDLAPSRVWILSFIGLLLYVPIPLQADLQTALRITLGLWIIRNMLSLKAGEVNRLTLFAIVPFVTGCLTASLPPNTAMIHQAFWVILWTAPAIILLGFAIRKMERGPTSPHN